VNITIELDNPNTLIINVLFDGAFVVAVVAAGVTGLDVVAVEDEIMFAISQWIK
jgi:hypothetical protein